MNASYLASDPPLAVLDARYDAATYMTSSWFQVSAAARVCAAAASKTLEGVDRVMKAVCSVLLAVASMAYGDVCAGHRCDTEACPCGCECGTASDPGLCYVPSTHSLPCDGDRQANILVTGATGRTGALLYNSLRASWQVSGQVRAFVRSRDKARRVLGCNECDVRDAAFSRSPRL